MSIVLQFLDLPEVAGVLPVARNAGAYPPIRPALRARLEKYFAPDTAKLRTLLRLEPGW
jgi:hypothetical protein